MRLTQAQQSQTTALTLLGVRTRLENFLHDHGGGFSGFVRPGNQALGRPLEVALVGFGHMVGLSGKSPSSRSTRCPLFAGNASGSNLIGIKFAPHRTAKRCRVAQKS